MLFSIKNHELYPHINLSLLERAINDNNPILVNKFSKQFENEKISEDRILYLLDNKIKEIKEPIFEVLEKQYGWEKLLAMALRQKYFAIAAFILERHSLRASSEELTDLVYINKQDIIYAFIATLHDQYKILLNEDGLSMLKTIKFRERLFKLLDPGVSDNELASCLMMLSKILL